MKIFDKLIDLGILVMNNPSEGIILIIILLLMLIMYIALYRNSKIVQKFINVLSNIPFPLIKREKVIMVVFTKKIAVFKNILNEYALIGYKKIEGNYLKKFSNAGDITRDELQKIVNKQYKKMIKAKKGIKKNDSFVYLGFPHVPLAFLDGNIFSGTDNVILYDYKSGDVNSSENGFFELKKIYNSGLEITNNYEGETIEKEEIILKIEQSFDINDKEIKAVVGDLPVIYLRNKNVERWSIESYSDVDIYVKEFIKVLTWAKNNEVKRIHLVATTPVSLTFSLGRVIEHYHPEVIVYNYNYNKYDWCVDIRNKKVNIIE